MSIIIITFLTFFFLAINFLFRKGIVGFKFKGGGIHKIYRYFPIAELVFWSVYSAWAANFLFKESSYLLYTNILIISLSFVLFSWFFIKDYISGVQIKSRFDFDTGQNFKSGQIKGVISKLGLLMIEIKSENGTDYKIPYSKIDQKSIELNFSEKDGGESSFSVDIDRKFNETETVNKITELIINAPWCSYKSLPIVKVIDANSKLITYKISCITIGNNGTRQLEELIQKEFGLLKP